MSASDALFLQIVDMNLGVPVDSIKRALIATNNRSAEAAINWIFEHPNPPAEPAVPAQRAAPPAQAAPQAAPAADPHLKKLRDAINDIGLGNASDDLLKRALKATRNNNAEAVMWVLNNINSDNSAPAAPAAPAAPKPKPEPPKPKELSVEERKKLAIEKARELQAQKKRDEIAREKAKKEAEKKRMDDEKDQIERRDEMARKLEERRLAQEAKRREEREKREKKALKDHIKREAFADKERAEAKEREDARKRLEARIKTPAQCLDMMTKRYGVESCRDAMLFVVKVFEKIIEKPDSQKYRKLDKAKAIVKDQFVIRVGGSLFLRLHGWTETEDFFLFKPKSTAKLQSCVADLTKRYRKDTGISQLVASMITSPDATWIGLSIILQRMENVLSSPSDITRKIKIEQADFKQWVGKNPQAVRILKSVGWTLRKEGDTKFFVLDKFDVGLLKQAVVDLKAEMKKLAQTRLREVRIFTEVLALQKTHGTAVTPKLKSMATKVLNRICNEPLNLRVQKISSTKIESKVPGISQLFLAFGFTKAEGQTLVLTSDVAALKHRTHMFERCVDITCPS